MAVDNMAVAVPSARVEEVVPTRPAAEEDEIEGKSDD